MVLDVKKAPVTPRSVLYAAFVDFKVAFDLASRNKLVLTLTKMGAPMTERNFLL